MWTDEERQKLSGLRIDSARHTREKLRALVDHFGSNEPGSLYSVKASQDFARKLRRLTESEELSWLSPPRQGHSVESPDFGVDGGLSSPERGAPKPRTYETRDRHISEMRWLAKQVLGQTTWDPMQLFGGNDGDGHIYVALAGGTPESGLLIDRKSRPPSISLGVEKHPAFASLLDHLSAIVPLSEAPYSLENALSKVSLLSANVPLTESSDSLANMLSKIDSEKDDFDPETAARVGQTPVPVSSFYHSFGEWKKRLSEAADIALLLDEELRQQLRNRGERLIEHDEVTDGILPHFTQTSIALMCDRRVPQWGTMHIWDGGYEREARTLTTSGESVIALTWAPPELGRIYRLAVSPDRFEALKELHQSQQIALESHPDVWKLVLALKHATVLERRMRDAVKSALDRHDNDFPGHCPNCS